MKLIPLTQGYSAKVDKADYEFLAQWKWQYHPKGYAYRRQHVRLAKNKYTGKFVLMHRVLCPNGITTDHINRDKLDNRKANLRQATRSQNQVNRGLQSNNTSGYKGVHYDKLRNIWRARVVVDRKGINLGDFKTPEEAAQAYNEKAKELHGEFALLNDIVLTKTTPDARSAA
jgi:hypothetical protein